MAIQNLQQQLAEAKLLSQGANPAIRKMALQEVGYLELALKNDNSSSIENAILEIRAAAGGDEAEIFAAELLRMYTKYAQQQGWKVESLDTNKTSLDGIKQATVRIVGSAVYSKLAFEGGAHRVQRIPKTEKRGRIHTSVATVAVLPEINKTEVEIKPEDMRVDVYRSSGHGGQSVNTTDSAVRITHISSGIVVTCQDERSQIKNRQSALMVLRAKLWQLKEQKSKQKEGHLRLSQIGSGERSDKIRTYNFPQDRLTDHRIGKSWSKLEKILNGDLDPIISAILQPQKKS